mgnify:CR=1 FL=1
MPYGFGHYLRKANFVFSSDGVVVAVVAVVAVAAAVDTQTCISEQT